MKLEFHPEALAEYEDAARHYAGCQEGLELRFIACVESTLQRLSQNPAHFRLFEADIRRCLVHVFPYAVLFTVEFDYVLIIAVMHCSREPGYWRDRTQTVGS
jgi:toxin ParE1/3/4